MEYVLKKWRCIAGFGECVKRGPGVAGLQSFFSADNNKSILEYCILSYTV